MGLDSVELVMDWENFFQIDIPDSEASKMATVADAVNYISTHVNYVDRGINIKKMVLNNLHAGFSKLNIEISQDSLISSAIGTNEEGLWKELSSHVIYELPLPFSSGTIGKWFDKLFPTKDNHDEVTFERFGDLVCAINYQTLVQPDVQNQYEVMIAVMGITIEKIGVSPFEVYLSSSFTNDLGID
jgi:hypothetical protein